MDPAWVQLACLKVTQELAPLEKPSVASREAWSLCPADPMEMDTRLPGGLISPMGSWLGESVWGRD